MAKMVNKINLNEFTVDKEFYGSIDLLLTVKSFNLQEIRQRYIASLKNPSSKRGSVERRASAMGGLVSLTIENGVVKREELLKELLEPRGIAVNDDVLAVSSEKKVFLISAGSVSQFTDPWFSYIHTISFNNEGKRILVSSSGFDALFEYDLNTMERSFQWFAWDHGLNEGSDPKTGDKIILSRHESDKGKEGYFVVTDPENEVLPTAMRAAFINSVEYDPADNTYMLATLFHHGEVKRISMKSGEHETVIDELKTPHGGRRIGSDFVATSTGSGEVVIVRKDQVDRFQFQDLHGKHPDLGNREWIQNSVWIKDFIVSIDSNRNSFVIFDPEKKLIDLVPYNDNWAVQDLVVSDLPDSVIDRVKSI